MNHYEKLATVLLRAVALILILFGLGGMASSAMFAAISKELFFVSGLYSLVLYCGYGLVGLALLVANKPLAMLIARKL